MNPKLASLHPYPFEKLADLKRGRLPPADKPHIAMSIGEPQHPTPHFIAEALLQHLHGLASYPTTKGGPELRRCIAQWLERRFDLGEGGVDPERQVLPVNGTREALFAFAQAVIDPAEQPLVLMPNPFYQIYEGAAILAGAEPFFLNTTAESGFLPDFDAVPETVWRRCRLVYICSPGNPTGAVMGGDQQRRLLELAERYDFIVASDECYSELYADEADPPAGLLQTAAAMGNTEFRRCVVFHSLSKRSNAPGLRSGFVAGDADILGRFLLYRTYHGCAMPLTVQKASERAWADEIHVRENRALYRRKFDAVATVLGDVLDLTVPSAGFYLWLRTPIDDTAFAAGLFEAQNVTVLPGRFLSRPSGGVDPGTGHVRIALVAPLEECVVAAHRIKQFIQTL
ncbi:MULTISPECIES: succinyldiaminopimelate transaminase [Methylococcus]|jgi:N-succinyldiaminopimelate aminotransferase|uniref:succinyldiaminopimelate transaminase n=1 Tax=Methylococcus TaxID=413 RepID=UPI001C527667|nr:succinyldiaminopimelate transaminase [Methylococcus capsulatus]QXP90833.1 succinyldiaminopimelate transaminase [Methylococcus capsulatus]QXP92447.1 succinyldiaminopimelate transaminase [Methylococcus capsulatus]